MQNKLRPTICNAEPSLRAKSRSQHLISKLTHFQISKLLILVLFPLWGVGGYAQQYDWQWALSGGGDIGGTGLGFSDEQIYDVKVGTDNNYYFISTIKGLNGAQLNGTSITVYNSSNVAGGGNNDIFIFSTTCDGQVRWGQAIGGEDNDRAYNLVLDNNNNVYVGAYVTGGSSYNIHFSPNAADDITPFPANMDAHKRIYLVKYDSNGVFQGKKAVQGTVSGALDAEARIFDLVIDSQNKLHFIVGLLSGTHLDNQVTVPSQYVYDPSTWTFNFQYRLVQYDTNLDYINSMVLPIEPTSIFPIGKNRFTFDETLNRYYIAGERELGFDLIYDGDAIVNRSFIIALNGINSSTGVDGDEVWRREINSTSPNLTSDFNRFNSLVVDSNSNVYVGGNLVIHPNDPNIKIYDPTDTSVQPYLFTPGADWTLPLIVKFNSSGTVQWAQATSAYSSGVLGPAPRYGKGLAINGSEVAFGVQSGADFWGAIEVVRPIINYQPDPVLVRFNKQTGAVINVHDIQGEAVSTKQMTAVAKDKDGNYITAGTFNANLFMNNTLGITPLVSTGEADFFVAKLAATPCGSGASTNKFNNLNVNVYPNPTTNIVNIETEENLFNYVVYDINGREIQNGMFGNNNQVNLQNANSGVYFIKVTTVQGSGATVKVVKK